jgi:hypothetical protein
MSSLTAAYLSLTLTLALSAAEPSFSGTWRLNMDKSKLSGQTFTISKNPSGAMHFASQGFEYDFDNSGKEFPVPDGSTTSWRESGTGTWDGSIRMNGKTIETFHLSQKGDTLTVTTKAFKADGSAIEETSVNTRVSGGPGVLGTWRSKELKGAPTTVVISTSGTNRVTLTYPEFQTNISGAFDGKDYVVKEAGADSKATVSLEKTGPNAFRMLTKINGKPFTTEVVTLSSDGKTLTDDSTPTAAPNERTRSVYERQ